MRSRHTVPRHCLGLICAVLASRYFSHAPLAEPYLAVRTGQACSACHVNPAGGGLRTAYGTTFGNNALPVEPVLEDAITEEIAVAGGLRVGGNARLSTRLLDLEGTEGNLAFATDRITLYGQLKLTDFLSLYVDQRVAPGGSFNRESWFLLSRGKWYLKGGKFFLPYGWRLEDDSAFIRRATGINFNTPDNGVEVGYDGATIQAQLAVTNGSLGDERDDGKFFLFRGSWLTGLGRLGISTGHNDTDTGDRKLYGLFAGFNTGPVAWLLEYDVVEDEAVSGPDMTQEMAFLEANWLVVRGHNLKLTLEEQRNDDEDRDRRRLSVVWEFFPWSRTQLRTGVRVRDSDDPAFREGEHYFIQLHLYF